MMGYEAVQQQTQKNGFWLNQLEQMINPIGFIYGIFPCIYHQNQSNVGKYTSPMDPRGNLAYQMTHLLPEIKGESPAKGVGIVHLQIF